jgi:hypothetical protein
VEVSALVQQLRLGADTLPGVRVTSIGGKVEARPSSDPAAGYGSGCVYEAIDSKILQTPAIFLYLSS